MKRVIDLIGLRYFVRVLNVENFHNFYGQDLYQSPT